MLRKTLVSMAVSGALYVSSSYALELGELTSQSSLNEPYRGKIELTDVGALTTEDILVRLGSESEFRQAGFAPTRVLSQLKFDVAQDNGEIIVSVTSDMPLMVDELHFVLAARWPSGQVVREYQVPLNQTALVEKAKSEVVQAAQASVPEETNTASGSVFRQATQRAQQMSSQGQFNVQRGNTLWSIAGRNRPANQLTIYQTMMAIQALNKDAFYSDNINLLKEGAVLRLPTQDQIALFNNDISREEFLRQHDAWMALKAARGATQGEVKQAQLNTQAEAKPADSTPENTGDKLTLASGQSVLPEKEASSNEGNDSALVESLKSELSASQEMLDKEQREKTELSDQLTELNNQLETLEQLINLKDKQMAELQQQLASAQQAMQEQKNTVDQLLEADQIRREKEQAEADSLMNKVFGNPIVVSIGAVVLLLLGFLIGLIMRRSGKKKAEEEVVSKDEFDLAPAAAAVAAAPVVAEAMDEAPAEPEIKQELPEEDPFAFDFDTPDEEVVAGDGESEEFKSFDEEVTSTEFPEVTDDDEMGFEEEAVAEDILENADEPEEFPGFEEVDDLPDPVLDLGDDNEDEPAEDEIPTMEPELDVFDQAVEEATADEEPETDDFDVFDEPEIDSDEASFVSNLLEDNEQEDVDESGIFNGVPDDSVENSIEETLAEMENEADDELEVPEFGEAEAASDEEASDDEEEFDFFDASGDEVATKLDLARAYMDMGDEEGARVILEDVVESGNEQQIAEAQSMMERMFPSD
ncbi:FimV/HubP family polar landmark protein [Marinomonas sp. THO17]|uniref:FimV/HubP family polar landmark protein n=1 Tax=Marinomonas sp. THO17 TaxID=3149048 RepID=UPI00336C023D